MPKAAAINLSELKNFGKPISEQNKSEIFVWPTEEDLERLQWKTLPTLKAIRYKGWNDGCMSAIQLVFTDGSESPLFDTCYSNSGELKTTEITGKNIKKVTAHSYPNDGDTSKLIMEHEKGT